MINAIVVAFAFSLFKALAVFLFLIIVFSIAIDWADSKLQQSRKRVTDKVSQMQLDINAEHNMHLMGTRTINHKIMTNHDEIMQQALTDRQL